MDPRYCRLCLCRNIRTSVNALQNVALCNAIRDLFGIQISASDKCTQRICNDCVSQVTTIFTFKHQVLGNQKSIEDEKKSMISQLESKCVIEFNDSCDDIAESESCSTLRVTGEGSKDSRHETSVREYYSKTSTELVESRKGPIDQRVKQSYDRGMIKRMCPKTIRIRCRRLSRKDLEKCCKTTAEKSSLSEKNISTTATSLGSVQNSDDSFEEEDNVPLEQFIEVHRRKECKMKKSANVICTTRKLTPQRKLKPRRGKNNSIKLDSCPRSIGSVLSPCTNCISTHQTTGTLNAEQIQKEPILASNKNLPSVCSFAPPTMAPTINVNQQIESLGTQSIMYGIFPYSTATESNLNPSYNLMLPPQYNTNALMCYPNILGNVAPAFSTPVALQLLGNIDTNNTILSAQSNNTNLQVGTSIVPTINGYVLVNNLYTPYCNANPFNS